jgi:hypothetical protein
MMMMMIIIIIIIIFRKYRSYIPGNTKSRNYREKPSWALHTEFGNYYFKAEHIQCVK